MFFMFFVSAKMPNRDSNAPHDRAHQGGHVEEDRGHKEARVQGQGDKRKNVGGPSGTPAKCRRDADSF